PTDARGWADKNGIGDTGSDFDALGCVTCGQETQTQAGDMRQSRPKLLFFVTVDWFFCSHFLGRAVAAQQAGYEVIVLTRVERHGEIIRDAGVRLLPLKISRSSLNPLGALRAL